MERRKPKMFNSNSEFEFGILNLANCNFMKFSCFCFVVTALYSSKVAAWLSEREPWESDRERDDII